MAPLSRDVKRRVAPMLWVCLGAHHHTLPPLLNQNLPYCHVP